MKTILVLRHAKSSWKDDRLPDHDRPLNKRGQRDAPRMGRLLSDLDLVPGRILSSTAVRARTTAEAVAEAVGHPGSIEYHPSLYCDGAGHYVEALRTLPVDVDRALIVGHNPDVEVLIRVLTGKGATMPTAALAHVECDIEDWRRLDPDGSSALHGHWIPKALDD